MTGSSGSGNGLASGTPLPLSEQNFARGNGTTPRNGDVPSCNGTSAHERLRPSRNGTPSRNRTSPVERNYAAEGELPSRRGTRLANDGALLPQRDFPLEVGGPS